MWEMSVEISLRKLSLPSPFEKFIEPELAKNNLRVLGIELSHVGRVAALPFHHRDPFDRILIAQSLVENFPIISKDGQFHLYNLNVFW